MWNGTKGSTEHICAALLGRIVDAIRIGEIRIGIVTNDPIAGTTTREASVMIAAIGREREVLCSIRVSSKSIWRSTGIGYVSCWIMRMM
jgi:hypothetical protein